MKVNEETTLGELEEWLRLVGLCLSVSRGRHGRWRVTLLPPGTDPKFGFARCSSSFHTALAKAIADFEQEEK